jgi:hypothetical protein
MEYKVGELVLLNAKNLTLKHPSKKLSEQFMGPFKVLKKLGTQAYELALPNTYLIHPTFHVSLLEPYYGVSTSEQLLPDLNYYKADKYEIEAIIGHTKVQGQNLFLVKWKGWTDKYNEYVAKEDMEGAK